VTCGHKKSLVSMWFTPNDSLAQNKRSLPNVAGGQTAVAILPASCMAPLALAYGREVLEGSMCAQDSMFGHVSLKLRWMLQMLQPVVTVRSEGHESVVRIRRKILPGLRPLRMFFNPLVKTACFSGMFDPRGRSSPCARRIGRYVENVR